MAAFLDTPQCPDGLRCSVARARLAVEFGEVPDGTRKHGGFLLEIILNSSCARTPLFSTTRTHARAIHRETVWCTRERLAVGSGRLGRASHISFVCPLCIFIPIGLACPSHQAAR